MRLRWRFILLINEQNQMVTHFCQYMRTALQAQHWMKWSQEGDETYASSVLPLLHILYYL